MDPEVDFLASKYVQDRQKNHSHSIVPGGLLVTS